MSSRKRIALAALACILGGSLTGPAYSQDETQAEVQVEPGGRPPGSADTTVDTRADDPQYATLADTPPDQEAPFGEKYYPVVTPGRRRPLMSLLDRAGLAEPLDEARIRIFGHVQGSYTHNFDDPALDLNLCRVFDIESNQLLLNQIDLNVERIVQLSDNNWDVGGRVEIMYGSDARFIHSTGLFDHHEDDGGILPGPENQFDLTQAYVDVAVPVGSGLRLRAGKFLFFKQVDPNASVFYSHSYTFGGALPFTLTGVSGFYELNDEWSVEGGINRGWDESLEDTNSMISFHGRVRYSPTDRASLALIFITGPEQPDNNGAYRTAIDLVGSFRATDRLTLMFDAVYGRQADPIDELLNTAAAGSEEADWFGLAGYAVYEVNDHVSVAGRLEWFRDEEGFIPVTAVPQDLFEATVGLTIRPFPNDDLGRNLKIRPEVRYDWSTEDFFDGLTSDNQFTAAVDVIFNF